MPELSLNNISIKRGNFSLEANGIFKSGIHIVTGKIGSGKTTLSMILSGFLNPDSGTISTYGIEKKMLSMQFPEYHLTKTKIESEIKSWDLSPLEILKTAELQGRGNEDPMNLSRGELKRLHLACVLSKPFDLLLLDEPFSSLDVLWKKRFTKNLNYADKLIIIFTHEQAVLPKADYIWEISKGKLNFIGKVPDSLDKWKNAPEYLKFAHEKGASPENIRFEDTLEALCRMQE
ncbi:ATP-binding cassette domain-containing protein [Methanoplanus sp. FWC-SCC4]|uniref:ATP-binding cassette domain-containing protein n=1 Tax=Methanochimaera problematica TaxID=2609417 RepID=A0AA97FD68_9EURY|nr:ATP-binding cassette domain-containing protein [Methanoplanus sp. FWC-SCC4]WOF16053.1 ATP-binding cassette domain-containing protein [Methanoplanus sp. FWC-SCC4]